MQPAIFLDRDGVIIENRSKYIRGWEDVEFFPAAVSALAGYASSAYHIVIVTNQSVVGRGIISLEDAHLINNKIIAALQENGCRVDGIFMCPHAPEQNCNCRKPRPGLLLEAAKKLSIDLPNSVMIGDAWTDLLAGQAAGVSTGFLVLTGRGNQQQNIERPTKLDNVIIRKGLAEALNCLSP